MQGELENRALLELGAFENLAEYVNTRAARRPDADSLAQRLQAGPLQQAGPPTPMFEDLRARLQAAGIHAELEADKLRFRFGPPTGEVLELAQPVPHPWLRQRQLNQVGVYPALDEYAPLVEANARLARVLGGQAPPKLAQQALAQLETRVQAFFDALLTPAQLLLRERQLFSARAIITPGADLRLDQVGLPDEIAWTLFGPLAARELGDQSAVQARSEQAAQALDEVMARSWLIVNRAPTLSPTALIAFHPQRQPGHVVRIHPLVCEMLNADFDGDQVALLLPLTEGAQREAGALLSVRAHLSRDPGLLEALLPPLDALWGLADLGLTQPGRQEIAQLAGVDVPGDLVSRSALLAALQKLLARDGVQPTLDALERLTRRGFAAARASGASLNPFVGASLRLPPAPTQDEPELWQAFAEELSEQLAASTDYASADLGPQLLMVRCRERGLRNLAWLVGSRGATLDAQGQMVSIRRGYAQGLTAQEMRACVVGAREALAELALEWQHWGQAGPERNAPGGFSVLARARRSQRPGFVFARAAANGEVDPLTDVYGKVLVGIGY
jgi:hypothetical protein